MDLGSAAGLLCHDNKRLLQPSSHHAILAWNVQLSQKHVLPQILMVLTSQTSKMLAPSTVLYAWARWS